MTKKSINVNYPKFWHPKSKPVKSMSLCYTSFFVPFALVRPHFNLLGAQPGLGTQPCYEAPGDLSVEYVNASDNIK